MEVKLIISQTNTSSNLKCLATLLSSGIKPVISESEDKVPTILDVDVKLFGDNTICRYVLLIKQKSKFGKAIDTLLDIEEFGLRAANILPNGLVKDEQVRLSLITHLKSMEDIFSSSKGIIESPLAFTLYPSLNSCVKATEATSTELSNIFALISLVEISPTWTQAKDLLNTTTINTNRGVEDMTGLDWPSIGLIHSLKLIFSSAIKAAFQADFHAVPAESLQAIITRCGNAQFGDFQCNNAMSISKALKKLSTVGTGTGTVGKALSPREIAEKIVHFMPANMLTAEVTTAANGFINIKISTTALVHTLASITKSLHMAPPAMTPLKILVDFSSPNIAKEMHVGHLRSTIIGDALCRTFEFCGHDVMRVNHVGDWGTQFGMLITYLTDTFPDILTSPPNISDLTVIYKASKQRFDTDEDFKERSRLNVVKLQSGDLACHKIWNLLCDISRLEFQKVYDTLEVRLHEVGESFYNPIIPGVIEELQMKGFVLEENGMLIIKLPHFTIPLIVRKSDGGYGYDSTDMAALSHRIRTLHRDWIIIITDAGQSTHFHMCFDTARAAGIVTTQRLDHIGFGVVCGDDGKRFKTRSSETVRLIDLLNAAKDRMKTGLQARYEEGKTSLQGVDLEHAARVIGYGAVKYFDLKQHPSTDYIFSYDRMLDTKGDTAVYLLFAFARLASILRKAREEKGIDVEDLSKTGELIITLEHPAERALAFELLQLNDTIRAVVSDLMPNKICEYLKEVCVKFSDFVTKCHVLNAAETNSRLLLCEATKRVMATCFHLLGINTLEKI